MSAFADIAEWADELGPLCLRVSAGIGREAWVMSEELMESAVQGSPSPFDVADLLLLLRGSASSSRKLGDLSLADELLERVKQGRRLQQLYWGDE